VEAKGEEDVESTQSLVPGVEIALGHRESVAQMEQAIHIGEGESLEEFGLLAWLHCEKLVPVPDEAGALLKRDEFVPADGALHLRID
jgi:hypothetical protein